MSYFLRRLPLSRLLLACGLAVLFGACATALALALDTGPTPPPKPLPQAVHDAFAAAPVEGVSARVQLTNHLLEGASLAGGSGGGGASGALASSPLVSGGSGRLWIAKDGHVRLELQSEGGDTEILYDGHTLSLYNPSANTLYHYTPPAHSEDSTSGSDSGQPGWGPGREPPTVARIEEAISRLSKNAEVSGAIPTDVAGQAAYTVRVTPREGGSRIGGAELSWDAVHGVPLRAAVYSADNGSTPALELASSEISYGPVDGSIFKFTPPPGTKTEEVSPPTNGEDAGTGSATSERPSVTTHGHGITTVAVVSGKAQAGGGSSSSSSSSPLPEGAQKVKIGEIEASELPTELGTLLTFERSGVRYLLLGAVSPAAVEEVAKGL